MVLCYAAFAKDLCTLLVYLSYGGDPDGRTVYGGKLITELGIKPPNNLPEKKGIGIVTVRELGVTIRKLSRGRCVFGDSCRGMNVSMWVEWLWSDLQRGCSCNQVRDWGSFRGSRPELVNYRSKFVNPGRDLTA
jgi:hypothetical protein